MKCFQHRDVDAVGICKMCNKGLCPTCAVDVGNGLACPGECVERVRLVNQMVDRSIRLSPVSAQLVGGQPRGLLVAGVFAFLAGGLFVMLGLDMDGTFRIGITGIGLLAMLMGAWHLARGLRLKRSSSNGAV